MGRLFFRVLLIAGAAIAISGCHLFHGIFGGGRPHEVSEKPDAVRDWRDVAAEADRNRVRDLRAAWIKALAQARGSGHGADIAALGALADPDIALDGLLPPGRYRCRTVKLGGQSPGMPDYIAYPPFECMITPDKGGVLAFEKVSGSQRQSGRLWPDGARRMVFLGTMALGDEQGALAYGMDSQRNVAGVLERVGPNLWRLALPWPRWESNLDLIELAPLQ